MNTTSVRRVIHTDTFTPKSQAILISLKDYMRRRWGSAQMEVNAILADVTVEPNGEITWTVHDSGESKSENSWRYRYAYYNRSTYASRRDDQKVREWIACSMKHAIYSEFRKRGLPETKNWKRTNKLEIECLSTPENKVTVQEAYCLFDRLLNRKTFLKRWGKKMLDAIVGAERDPVATELEIARREEVKKLEDTYKDDKAKLESECYSAIRKAEDEVRAKYKKMQEERYAAYLQAKKELDEALQFATTNELV